VFPFERGGAGSSDGAPVQRAPRTRREAAEPRDEQQAPYGRDGDGNAYAPFGVKGNGAPKKAFGRHAKSQEEAWEQFRAEAGDLAAENVQERFDEWKKERKG
jgi:hypothetical protein